MKTAKLGSGAFGDVFKATCIANGEERAIKRISKAKLDSD
jgi:hypothetical protein